MISFARIGGAFFIRHFACNYNAESVATILAWTDIAIVNYGERNTHLETLSEHPLQNRFEMPFEYDSRITLHGTSLSPPWIPRIALPPSGGVRLRA